MSAVVRLAERELGAIRLEQQRGARLHLLADELGAVHGASVERRVAADAALHRPHALPHRPAAPGVVRLVRGQSLEGGLGRHVRVGALRSQLLHRTPAPEVLLVGRVVRELTRGLEKSSQYV